MLFTTSPHLRPRLCNTESADLRSIAAQSTNKWDLVSNRESRQTRRSRRSQTSKVLMRQYVFLFKSILYEAKVTTTTPFQASTRRTSTRSVKSFSTHVSVRQHVLPHGVKRDAYILSGAGRSISAFSSTRRMAVHDSLYDFLKSP